ncbi:cytochrome C oxidase subunit II [Paenibacillus radicis (ex Gao et al. 2016)]|uniref:Cytochrome C oxidase subunit II n=1 Tax=Paenibacillus radicis (ex Gao et al. 2016) TaxID=1737354 RepID=A0A917MC75_9BACL|nr:cytochrome C oxidase subunit II [Paenibacillus radicis (ex Gao et al. 2016)]GGG90837.1 hypothetical protein GCM10010918_57310 [Paenibacillus radicis (ex Gao et al. 2016)]
MKKWILFAAVLCLVAVIAACGSNKGNSEPTTSGVSEPNTAAPEVVIKAKSWEFDKAEYKIKAGEPVNLTLESNGGVHGIDISKTDIKIANKKTKAVTLEAGVYDIVCNVPCGNGHAKMTAKLVVE